MYASIDKLTIKFQKYQGASPLILANSCARHLAHRFTVFHLSSAIEFYPWYHASIVCDGNACCSRLIIPLRSPYNNIDRAPTHLTSVYGKLLKLIKRLSVIFCYNIYFSPPTAVVGLSHSPTLLLRQGGLRAQGCRPLRHRGAPARSMAAPESMDIEQPMGEHCPRFFATQSILPYCLGPA